MQKSHTTSHQQRKAASTPGNTKRLITHPQALTVINIDGTNYHCPPTQEAVYEALGGARKVGLVPLGHGRPGHDGAYLLVDADGRLKDLEFNVWASEGALAELFGVAIYVPKGLLSQAIGRAS
jgi:hypothetical protein